MTLEVGYENDGYFSINLIEANDRETAELYALAHANRYGYKLAYMNVIPEWYKEECIAKGMPLIKA